MPPKLSIVMPAYNHQRFVGEAVQSVLDQSFSDFEFIIIDDGSTDDTAKVIKSYDDPRIQYYYQENQDAYNALNNGMAKATGDYIAILNSDDVYMPERFTRLMSIIEKTQAQCLFTDVLPINDDSQLIEDENFGWNLWHQKNRAKYFESNDVYKAFLHGNYMVTTSNLLISRQLVEQVGGFTDLRYLHDYDYIFRLMLASPQGVHYVHDEQLLKYRIHDGNTLSEAAIIGREQDQHVIRKYLLARFDQDQQALISTGLDRLLALELELLEVKQQLELEKQPKLVKQPQQKSGGLTQNIRSLLSRLINKCCK